MMRKEKCELCVRAAKIYCDSDHASLCWDCDRTVHSANFLVAKHTRSVLCNVCHSPTPWRASGFRLYPTVSICELCVHRRSFGFARASNRWDLEENRLQEVNWCDHDGDNGPESSDSDDEDEEDEEEEDKEEVAENQVVPVPWLAMAEGPQQPRDMRSSSSIGRDRVLVKRKLGISEGIGCSAVHESNDSGRLKRFFRYRSSLKSTAMANSIVRRKSDGCESPSSSSSSPLMANKRRDLSC